MAPFLLAQSGEDDSPSPAKPNAPDASAAAEVSAPTDFDDPADSDRPANVTARAGAPSDRLAAEPPATGGTRLPPAIPGGANVAIIKIEGLIYGFTLESLQRRVDKAIAMGASLIVIELDTPGGVVTSALDIAKYIKGKIPVPTVAWINDQAYSAGILIASACDMIVMSPASTTGDCAPIVPGKSLSPTERAKALSPILEEFADNAERNGYDYAMFHAMCVLGVAVYQIQHKETGEVRLVNEADYQVMVRGAVPDYTSGASGVRPPPNIQPTAPPSPPGGGTLPDMLDRLLNPAPPRAPSGAGGAIPANVGAVSVQVAFSGDRGKWKLIKPVHDGRTLLTVRQSKAYDIGLAQADDIATENDLLKFLNAKNVFRVSQTWSEDIAGWLTSPMVRAVLVIAVMLGAYVEFQSPGLGLPGAVAAVALILLLGAPFLVGLAEVWHVLLFFLGFLLLLVEVFITPGFGLLGLLGIVCMLTGLVLQIVPAAGNFRLPAQGVTKHLVTSIYWTMLSLIGGSIGFFFLIKYFGNIPVFDRLVLHNPHPAVAGAGGGSGAPGAVAAGPPLKVSGDEAIGQGHIAVGAVGRAATQLHPTGRAEIDGQMVDVITLGGWIESGRPIEVIEVHGNRIVVDLRQEG